MSRNLFSSLLIGGALLAAGCQNTPAPSAGGPATPARPAASSPAAPASAAPASAAPASGAPAASGQPAGDATYKSDGQVPPPAQVNAMLEDTVVHWNQAMQARDFKPFVAWQAKAAQQYMKPDEDVKMTQTLVDNKVDLTQFKGVEPKFLKAPAISDSQFGKMLAMVAEYNKGTDQMQVDVKYIDEAGTWKVGEIHVVFDRNQARGKGGPAAGASEAPQGAASAEPDASKAAPSGSPAEEE